MTRGWGDAEKGRRECGEKGGGKTANIRSFKELKVWQNAMDAAMVVFELTKGFPIEEKYSLTDQFRRASRSVASNNAEASRKRRYRAAFISKLNDSEGEAAECPTWTEFALRCGYLSDSEAGDLDARYEQILAQLVTMIEHPKNWIIPPSPRPRVSPSPRLPVPASPRPRVISPSPHPRVSKPRLKTVSQKPRRVS